jgi:hypothetical protein
MRRKILFVVLAILAIAGLVLLSESAHANRGPDRGRRLPAQHGLTHPARGKEHPSFYSAHVSRARSEWAHASRAERRLCGLFRKPGRSGNGAGIGPRNHWRRLERVGFSPSGDKLYGGNGSRGSLTEFSLNGANLSIQRKIDLYPRKAARHTLSRISLPKAAICSLPIRTKIECWLSIRSGNRPTLLPGRPQSLRQLLSPDGESVLVSSWSTAHVFEYRLSDGKELASIPVGAHPTERLWLPLPAVSLSPPPTPTSYMSSINNTARGA